jgi:hypothetical protein
MGCIIQVVIMDQEAIFLVASTVVRERSTVDKMIYIILVMFQKER